MNDNALRDKRIVRRSFESAARAYDAAAVLQREVCGRMLSRLDYIKHTPATILDAGSGTGNALAGLHARYPQAAIYALDIAHAMVRRARAHTPWWRWQLARRLHYVCGDIERLPLREGACSMVWSNLALQWVANPQQAVAEIKRVLMPGGLMMFSTFGPDTLKELRAAYAGVDHYQHVNRFIDMHDLGDMLVQAGFADPVMDMEIITLTYPTALALMRDLKTIGASHVSTGARAGLTARAILAAVERNYETWRREGELPATFEVVYGHAWVPAVARRAGAPQVVQWHSRKP